MSKKNFTSWRSAFVPDWSSVRARRARKRMKNRICDRRRRLTIFTIKVRVGPVRRTGRHAITVRSANEPYMFSSIVKDVFDEAIRIPGERDPF